MAKLTLLEMTQDILRSMDSDAVNSISDTIESDQVANIIVQAYYELYAGRDVPYLEGVVELDALTDPSRPVFLKIPDNVKDIKWIRYNGKNVPFRDQQLFLNDSFERMDADGVPVPDVNSNLTYYIFTDADPTYWTTFDDVHIVFNGYDSATDTTLQNSKTVCWGQFDPVFVFDDNAYAPYLPGDAYPGLLAEAKATAFIDIKQVASSKEEQKSKRQRVREQNDLWRADQRRPYNRLPDYGRKGRLR